MEPINRSDMNRLADLLLPYARNKQKEVKGYDTRFAYYTSAEVAISIIRKKEVWMRHAAAMNDFREIDHGVACLTEAFEGDGGHELRRVLNRVHPGTAQELDATLRAWIPHFRYSTYIACFSEHPSTEDPHGRLSMWRAYGGNTSVALILNSKVFFNESNVLKAYTAPVAYWDVDRFEQEMATLASNIEENADFIYAVGKQRLLNTMFNVCRFSVLCSKHPGFLEEREWRVVYSPTIEQSSVLVRETVVIAETPQTIYKIPLKDIPEEGFVGAELPALLDRIIVGPTKFPVVAGQALAFELEAAQVPNAGSRVSLSEIPLRR